MTATPVFMFLLKYHLFQLIYWFYWLLLYYYTLFKKSTYFQKLLDLSEFFSRKRG